MNRLDSYIFNTVAMTMGLAVAGLLGLDIILTFLEQMKDVVNDYTIFHVFRFVLYSMPRMFYEVIPYSALIGCLAGLGLLASSSELVVIRAPGFINSNERSSIIPTVWSVKGRCKLIKSEL